MFPNQPLWSQLEQDASNADTYKITHMAPSFPFLLKRGNNEEGGSGGFGLVWCWAARLRHLGFSRSSWVLQLCFSDRGSLWRCSNYGCRFNLEVEIIAITFNLSETRGTDGKTGNRRNVSLRSDDRYSNSATVSGKTIGKRPVCAHVSRLVVLRAN